MSEFIKLTLADGGPFYLSKSSPIIGMHRVASPQDEGTVLLLGATNRVVTETPEEIMAMLEVKTNQFPGLMARLDEAIRQRDEAEQKNDVLSIAANKRLISANEILSVAVTAKTNQVEDLLKRLDQALQQRDEALLQNDELPAANEALKSANKIMFDTLTARTAQVDSLTGRLSNVLQLNYDLRNKTHLLNSELQEALRQRDEATRKRDSFKAAYLSATSG